MDAGWYLLLIVANDYLKIHQVTGLVHDLGKLLFMFGSEGQWDVVGVSPKSIFDNRKVADVILQKKDTFVVGCKFSDKTIFPETFAGNPDSHDALYNTECGIYPPHCGLDNVILSWGHDEVFVCHPYTVWNIFLTCRPDNASTFTACLKIRVLYL